MHKTAWSKTGSSVPSDRILPIHKQAPTNSKGKGKQLLLEPPKSKETRRLETLLRALRDSRGSDRDQKGGCFCQAREHALSPCSPLCNSCGLILCSVNLPQYACPHCASPVVTVTVRNSIVIRLESQISETIAQEKRDREKKLEEARQAAGAFPTLTGQTERSSGISPSLNSNQPHKVLSLNSATKKVTLSSYNTTLISSRPSSRAESEEEEPIRVPPPPTEVVHSKRHVDRSRPWENLTNSRIGYVPLARVDSQLQGSSKNTG
ncbi:hypothetical protein BDZ94DRAFT_1189355 [Collybia nuda]|uniref:TRIP4/RQT4 C2HC5-type zinc finger domain-containing protein n=1 Tax=Collybia nuda TaxID=64659 RepID=A0A9P5YA58_9AGAR|nr:hypothetical protein BDZ94DRAFT_1189355 [Collybia nuda]